MTDLTHGFKHFLGIDVSKRTLDVCLLRAPIRLDRTHAHTVTNDEAGFAELVRWLAQHHAPPEQTVVCMENTGLYDDRLLEALTLAGYPCAVEKTTVLTKMRPEHHRKDDAFDAALLAEYAWRYADRLRLWQAPTPVIEEIRVLYRERRRLLTHRGAVQQLHAEAPRRTADTRFAEGIWQEQIAFFDGQIARLDAKLQALVASDDEVQRRYELVKSIPGFGPVASLLWTTLFFGEEQLSARRIASRFGFAPHGRQTGTSLNAPARSTGHGQSEVRKVLTLCARSAGTHDARAYAYKQKKLREGKESQVVTNNLINKLIRVATAVWNEGTVYDPNHVSRFTREASLSP
jgi:transposase